MTFRRSWFGLAALALAGSALAQSAPAPQEPTPDQKKEIAKKLDAKTGEMEALKGKAVQITKNIGELASSGKLPTSADAIELMKKMVEEMTLIRLQLDKVTAEVDGIKAWIAGRKEPAPVQSDKDLDLLKKTKLFGFLQVQYRDTNQTGGANDAFSVRRMRIGLDHQANPKTSMRVSFDHASGTNQQGTILKDAYLNYDLDPTKQDIDLAIRAGQHTIPLGYDIVRGDIEREFPERAQYSQKLFNGERSQGISVRYGMGNGVTAHVGGWNALAVSDSEQANLAPGGESRLAMSAGLRKKGSNYEVGLSGFKGERPTFVSGTGVTAVTHPRVDREFIYVDGYWSGIFNPKLYIRGEAMWGKDRLPVTGTPAAPRGQTDMNGYQVQMGYNFNWANQLNVRFEQFDPNSNTDGNAIIGYGAAWNHFLNPNTRITAAHEIFDDAARASVGQQRYHITTLRVTFRY